MYVYIYLYIYFYMKYIQFSYNEICFINVMYLSQICVIAHV